MLAKLSHLRPLFRQVTCAFEDEALASPSTNAGDKTSGALAVRCRLFGDKGNASVCDRFGRGNNVGEWAREFALAVSAAGTFDQGLHAMALKSRTALFCNLDKNVWMKTIISYLKNYISAIHKPLFACAVLFTALAVYINYAFGLNRAISRLGGLPLFLAWYAVFLLAFGYGYLLQVVFLKSTVFRQKRFLALLLLAPAVFAWKMSAHIEYDLATDMFQNDYWNDVVYWPFKLVVMLCAIYLLHRFFDRETPFYGVTSEGFKARPYVLMLLVMIPLIAAAATQRDFLSMYPRFQNVPYLLQPGRGWHKLLYELSYGSDFFSIELFFRGFLVLAFARWVGKEAILPMAIFYCTIHFGKPLGECISSFVGGLILGVVAYNSRSIIGGFLVHVGIAWLMELGGYLGKL